MTINKQALRKLIEAWEAGDAELTGGERPWGLFADAFKSGSKCGPAFSLSVATYDEGSLDAAEAIHDALLPDWVLYRMQWWKSASPPAVVEIWGTTDGSHSFKNGRADAKGQTPASAWGLAILKAVEALE